MPAMQTSLEKLLWLHYEGCHTSDTQLGKHTN